MKKVNRDIRKRVEFVIFIRKFIDFVLKICEDICMYRFNSLA